VFRSGTHGFRIPGRRHVLPAVFLALAAATDVHAHGLVISASTSVLPPRGFEWVAAVCGLGFVLGNAFILRAWRLDSWGQALVRAIGMVFTFAISLMVLGLLASSFTTAPLPGLSWPHPVFWGLGWHQVGFIFVAWNAVGLLVLRRTARRWLLGDTDAGACARRVVLRANMAIYLVGLLPFMLSGAITHGWAGSHVATRCRSQLSTLGAALLRFSRDNGGRLPVGQHVQGVFAQVRPYVRSMGNWWDHPIYVCPVCAAFKKDPEPYVWNAELSGKTFEQLQQLERPEPLISCPCGHLSRFHGDIALYTRDLLAAHEVGEDEYVILRGP